MHTALHPEGATRLRATHTLKTLATLGLVLLCAVTFAQTPAKDTASRLLTTTAPRAELAPALNQYSPR